MSPRSLIQMIVHLGFAVVSFADRASEPSSLQLLKEMPPPSQVKAMLEDSDFRTWSQSQRIVGPIFRECYSRCNLIPMAQGERWIDGTDWAFNGIEVPSFVTNNFRQLVLYGQLFGHLNTSGGLTYPFRYSGSHNVEATAMKIIADFQKHGLQLSWDNTAMVYRLSGHYRPDVPPTFDERFDYYDTIGYRRATKYPIWDLIENSVAAVAGTLHPLPRGGSEHDGRRYGISIVESLSGSLATNRIVFLARSQAGDVLSAPNFSSRRYLVFLDSLPPSDDLSKRPPPNERFKLFLFWEGGVSLEANNDEWSNFVLKKQFGISSPDEILPFFRFAVRYAKAPPEERARLDDEASEMGEPYKKLVESAKEYFTRKESKP